MGLMHKWMKQGANNQNKFFQGFYLSSTVNLKWAVEKVLKEIAERQKGQKI